MFLKITPEKAEILGLLCAEGNYRGYVDIYFEKSRKRRTFYLRERWKEIIEFSNTDISLLQQFVDLLLKEYNYRPKIVKSNNNVFRVCITKNKIIRDLLSYTDFGCLKWRVPPVILNSDYLIKVAFIRGFFDGDGCIDFANKKIPRIRITSSNYNGLDSISKLLDSINLRHSMNGPYLQNNRLPIFELLLKTSSVKRFASFIGSKHKNKNIKLQRIIAETNTKVNAEVDKLYPQSHNLVVRQPAKLVGESPCGFKSHPQR